MVLLRSLAFACVLLAALEPTAAQLGPKQAEKAARAAGRQEIAAFRATAQGALAEFRASLSAFEASFSAETPVAHLVEGVAARSTALLDALHTAAEEASSVAHLAAAGLLDDLLSDGGAPDDLPKSFAAGSGGVLDDFAARLAKAADTARRRAVQRLSRTARRAEERALVGLLVNFRFPPPLDLRSLHVGDATPALLGARLDLLVAGSRLGVSGDGVLFFSGRTDVPGDVDVSLLLAPAILDCTTLAPAGPPGRFSGVFDASGAGLAEGNYLVLLDQGGGPFDGALRVGLR